jgi:hypothetical protein
MEDFDKAEAAIVSMLGKPIQTIPITYLTKYAQIMLKGLSNPSTNSAFSPLGPFLLSPFIIQLSNNIQLSKRQTSDRLSLSAALACSRSSK